MNLKNFIIHLNTQTKKNILAHYKTTGEEILQDLGNIDYFFGGLGTTGSARGTAEKLKEKNPSLISIGVVASEDDFIPGIRKESEMWEVGLFDKSFYNSIEITKSEQAIEDMITLIRKVGMMYGPTSGSAFSGILNYFKKIL